MSNKPYYDGSVPVKSTITNGKKTPTPVITAEARKVISGNPYVTSTK